MKTIQDKANEYALDMNEKCDGFFNCRSLVDAYVKGATEALASQWRSVEDGLPETYDDVLVVYPPSYSPSHIEKAVAYYDGEDWYTKDGEHIRPSHWMPIPEPPKTDKK